MRGELRVVRPDDRECAPRRAQPARPRPPSRCRSAGLEPERGLAAAHGEVHVREDARIEQRAVQVAAGVVDAVALAERVEAVALAGMHAPRERERVADAAVIGNPRRAPCGRELGVQEADVELRIVDHELGVVHEGEEFLHHIDEGRLRLEELVRDAMDGERAGLHLAAGPQVAMPVPARSGAGAGARCNRSR